MRRFGTGSHARWRSKRIGICVTADAACGVLVEGGRVTRTAAIPLSSPVDQLDAGEAVTRLVESLAPGKSSRPPVVVALGITLTQTRKLVRLPRGCDARTLLKLVRTNAGRFFLKNGVPLATSGVQLVAEGEGWAAAAEAPLVDAVLAACEARKVRLQMVLPALATVSFGLSDTFIRWREGDRAAEVGFDSRRRMNALRYYVRDDSESGNAPAAVTHNSELPPAAGTLGQSTCWAAAVGAATMGRSDLAIVAPSALSKGARVPSWRMGLAAVALTLAAVSLIAAPIVSIDGAAGAAATRLHGAGADRRAALRTDRELALTTAKLDELAAFARARHSPTFFLRALTGALPEDASLLSLRLDDGGGTLVLVAPRVMGVLADLGELKEITEPTVVGAVSPLMLDGERLERATIRFRWTRRPSDPSSAARGSRP